MTDRDGKTSARLYRRALRRRRTDCRFSSKTLYTKIMPLVQHAPGRDQDKVLCSLGEDRNQYANTGSLLVRCRDAAYQWAGVTGYSL